ncbi:MAG: diguanylate cyclase [Thermodesulfobacteriota bacterium]|nr:diguanylate cyclase [Thermodesulfobacteriota bacterium]
MRLRTQLFIILSLIIISVVGTIGYSVYKRMGAHYLEQTRTAITGYAYSASLLIDGDIHEGFTDADDMASPAFMEMRDKMRSFMEADARISEMYTMVRTQTPNIWQFVIDAGASEDDDGDGVISDLEKPASLGEAYDVTPYPEMQRAFEGPIADREINRDKWGWWLSAYCPIYNSAGEAVAIVGIDIAADIIRDEMSQIRNMILFSCLVFLGLALIVSNAYAYSLTKPLNEMVKVSEEIGRGHYDQRISVAKKNEMGFLAGTMNHMAESISRSFDKLSALNRMASILASTFDLGQALEISLSEAMGATRSTRGALFMVLDNEERMELAASRGIDDIRPVDEQCYVGDKRLPVVLGRDPRVHVREWLEMTGCTRCFFLTIKERLRGVFLLNPQAGDEEFLDTMMTEISFGIENARLFQDAITDSTTGLFMKRYFQIQIETEAKRSRRYKRGLSILILDIDDFKGINDTHGHPFGDLVLKEVAEMVSRSARETDVVARYGGDEIVVILADSTKEMARVVADRILRTVGLHEFRYGKEKARVTVSIGISNMTGQGPVPPEELLRLADAALYTAKEAGKNSVHVA